jgi:glycosyltransferase involved in cell wall biosynthesis
MKILYLCSDAGIPVLGRKGASVHVREMAAAFHRAGHHVILAAQLLNKSPWESPAQTAASVLQLRPAAPTLAAVAAMKLFTGKLGVPNSLAGELRRILHNQEVEDELLRRFDHAPPDFIYERASLFSVAGVGVARKLGVPLLLELNAPLATEQSTYRGNGLGELAAQAERWTLTQADAVLAVSSLLRDHAVSLGAEPARVQVVPNGVNSELFKPGAADRQLRQRLGLADGPVLGFVGGLRPWHGVEVLPDLLERLAPRHPRLQLLIVGEGPLRPELERRLNQRNLSGRVVFTGALAHEQVGDVIRLFEVALAPYPALDHAFYFSPLKVFEYMACGVGVVAARCGQIAELVRDGETGLLYPAGDFEALAQACDRMLGEPKLRHLLGERAADFVRTHFTWDRNAARAVELARQCQAARQECAVTEEP